MSDSLIRLPWLPWSPNEPAFEIPQHLKNDFRKYWFAAIRDESFVNGTMQGYLENSVDLWKIAGAHCREYFEKHGSAVVACFDVARMAEKEFLYYRPLVELIHKQLRKVRGENTEVVHRGEDLQIPLFQNDLPVVAGRGGGRSPSSTGSRFSFDFGFNTTKPNSESTREPERRAIERRHGYTQDDFDARDLRKLAAALSDCDPVLKMQPHLSEDDVIELACGRIGLPVKKAKELLKSQRRESKAFAAAGD